MVNENRFAGVILNIALSPLIFRKSSRTVRRREGILKKSAVIIIVAIIAVFALTALVACVNTDLSGIGFAQGFEDALSCFDFTLSKDADVRVMSYNILAHMKSWGGSPVPPRAKMLLMMLDEIQPDVIGIQEMSSDWHKVLEANLGDEYVVLHPDIDIFNKNKTPIIYNKDKLMLIESGYYAYKEGDENACRAITWGLFTVKATGKYVIVTNTHLNFIKDGQESKSLEIMKSQAEELISKINELYGRYSCPVIACGDYNSMESGDIPDAFGDEYGVRAAKDVYDKLAAALTDVKFMQDTDIICADESIAAAPSWDHIFLKGDATADKFFIVDGQAFENVSDHYAIFADFKF